MVTADDRGQAFTLEGFVASIVLLSAVLFALQATVITPTSGGQVSESTRGQLSTEASDLMDALADDPETNFANAVRRWDATGQVFDGAVDDSSGYGSEGPPPELFDGAFEETFTERGYTYNLVLHYRGGNVSDLNDGGGTLALVYRGPPAPDAVSVSQTVTLFDNTTLDQEVNNDGRQLWEYDTDPSDGDDGYFPIPDAAPRSPLYNVVEVRLTVW
ncbi:DUF7288 family protein [Salinigranum halophilum]|uniref:DUF7288 family protein n=1 Tax=Salinigranum halophilum TaxID=2565931 RepID=UPI0010A82F53|nr:hypothetical protein [Salinigranum halophilum]